MLAVNVDYLDSASKLSVFLPFDVDLCVIVVLSLLVHYRCVPSMVLISWSTSVATAAPWLSISVSALPTFAILAMTISSV